MDLDQAVEAALYAARIVAGGRPAQLSAPSAIRVSRPRIASSGSRPLCGVELISPNAACAIDRAVGELEPGIEQLQLGGPEVDVLPLERAHPLAGVGRQRLPVAVLHHDQRSVPQREVDVPVDQGGQRSLGVGRLGDPAPALPEQLLADRDQHLGEHRLLRREVLVERRPGDPARRAEVGDRDAVVAALGEQLRRRGEDLVAAAHGVPG